MKKKNLAFTLAEVLIVIGIIGVVAALTLPNLNHATGDKETVTRLQKFHSILSEANDRMVAIYGPVSTWSSNEECARDFSLCYMRRIKEFLKVSKSCNQLVDSSSDEYSSCENFGVQWGCSGIYYQLADGMMFDICPDDIDCKSGPNGWNLSLNDICSTNINVDVDGPNKGKDEYGHDIFQFMLSDSQGVMPVLDDNDFESEVRNCLVNKNGLDCTWWVLEYGNQDYLKANEEGKCNDSNIILNGTTNTSCH